MLPRENIKYWKSCDHCASRLQYLSIYLFHNIHLSISLTVAAGHAAVPLSAGAGHGVPPAEAAVAVPSVRQGRVGVRGAEGDGGDPRHDPAERLLQVTSDQAIRKR